MTDAEKLTALAARLRNTLGRRVNKCLDVQDSVRLRTDAERINNTVKVVENILQEFGL